jgi:AcrR family transcriptional regulator
MAVKEPRRQSRAEETRRLLLDAAQNIFGRKGYHDASMDDIVQAADRSKGAAYFHFPGKGDIFRAVLNRLADRLERKVHRAVALETMPIARLDAALAAVLDAFTGHRRVARLALVELVGAGPAFQDTLAELRLRFRRLIKAQLDEAIDKGAIAPVNTRLVSLAWFGAINEIVLAWLRRDEASDLKREIPELRAMLLKSVGVDPHTRLVMAEDEVGHGHD